MRKLLILSAALVAAACSDSTGSRVPTEVVVAPNAVVFDLLRNTQVVRATVNDQNGRVLGDADLTWTSDSPAVTVVSSAGDSAVLSSVKNGTANVTARAGEASGSVQVQVSASGRLEVTAGDNQAGLVGSNIANAPAVRVLDSRNVGVPGVEVTFTATEGGGSPNGTGSSATVVTDARGVATLTSFRLGAAGVLNLITARTSDINAPPATLQISACTGAGPGFNITLCYTTPMTPSQRAVFEAAAARWSTVITGDLPDATGRIPGGQCGANSPTANFVYDDLVIFAAAIDIDGPGQVLGQAGPCYIRTASPRQPFVGVMQFDLADLNRLENNGGLSSVILHEMGHVIGIGTLWTTFGLLQNPSTQTNRVDTYYTGPGGLQGFEEIGGSRYTAGQKVPVENQGGEGTANGHWRETVLRNELMTGFLNEGANPMSVLTIRSLQDLGYMVNVGVADPFSIFPAVRLGEAEEPAPIRMHNDIFRGPLYEMDVLGRTRRVQ